jgi:hypothetical protein
MKGVEGRHPEIMRVLGRSWNGERTVEEMLAIGHEVNNAFAEPREKGHVEECVRDVMKMDPCKAGPTVLVGPKLDSAPTICNGFEYVIDPQDYNVDEDNFEGWFPLGEVSLIFGIEIVTAAKAPRRIRTRRESPSLFSCERNSPTTC